MMTVYLVPNLSQPLYLGTDFFRKFDLKIFINEISLLDSMTQNIGSSERGKLHDLTYEQKFQLETVVKSLPDYNQLGLGKTHLLEHCIDVGGAEPIKQRHYHISPAIQKEMYLELDRMLKLGAIEESQSPWCSSMALVRKSNGNARLCLDARKVNELTKKDAYPLPIIDGLLGRLDQTRFLSCLDLKDAFWQIHLDVKLQNSQYLIGHYTNLK